MSVLPCLACWCETVAAEEAGVMEACLTVRFLWTPGAPEICVAPGDAWCWSMAHEERYLFQKPNCHFVAA